MLEILDDNLTWLETPVCKDGLVYLLFKNENFSCLGLWWLKCAPENCSWSLDCSETSWLLFVFLEASSKAPEISWINQAESNQTTFQTTPKQKDINRKKHYSFYHHGSGKWLYLKGNHTIGGTYFSLNHDYGRNKVPSWEPLPCPINKSQIWRYVSTFSPGFDMLLPMEG